MAIFFMRINQMMEQTMFILTPLALLLGYTFHQQLKGANLIIIIAFAWMTFLTGINCSWRQFASLVNHPGMLVAIMLLLHLIIPIFTYFVGKLFYYHDPLTRQGLVLAVSIPVGVTAAIWTFISRANNAFTLSLVVLDTLLSPIILPIVAVFVIGTTGAVSMRPLVQDLMLMVVIPSLMGLFFHPYRWWPTSSPTQSLLNISSKLALFLVIAINVAQVHDTLASSWRSSVGLIITLAFITGLAYLLGFFTGRLLNRPIEDIKAMTYSAGMRNIGLGIVFATGYFHPRVTIPVILFVLIQQPMASLVHYFLEKIPRTKKKPGIS